MGYCDHFGLRRIAESEVRTERLAAALKARRGTLAVSWLNLGEYATVTSRETRLQVERLKSAHEVNTSSEEGGRCGRAAYTRLMRPWRVRPTRTTIAGLYVILAVVVGAWRIRATKTTVVGLYVVLAVVFGVVVGHLNLPTYWQLLRFGRSAHAVVLRTNCDNHASVFYRFEVQGREYEDSGSAGYGNPDCRELKPGHRIMIYYVPSKPDLNIPGEIRERWNNELAFLALAVTIMPLIVLYGIFRKEPSR